MADLASPDYTGVDTSIYGDTSEPPVPRVPSAVPQSTPEIPGRVPVPEVVSPRIQQAGAALEAQQAQPSAPVGEAVIAAAQETGTARLWEFYKKPSFEAVPGHNSRSNLAAFNRPLTPDEEEFLLGSRSPEEDQYVIQRVQEVHAAQQVLGDYPFLALTAAMLDPVYIAADVLSAGTTRALRVGRLATAALAGAGAGAIAAAEAQVAPVSGTEIAANVAMSALAGTLLRNPRNGRIESADPEFPRAEVDAKLQEMQPPKPNVEQSPVREYSAPEAAAPDDIQVPRGSTGAGYLDADPAIAQSMRKAQDELQAVAQRPAKELPTQNFAGRDVPAMRASDVLRNLIRSADEQVSAMARHLEARSGPVLDDVPVYSVTRSEMVKTGGSEVSHVRRYGTGDLEVRYVLDGSSALNREWTMLHELTHAATVNRLALGRDGVLPEHARIYRELDALRNEARRSLDTSDPVSEHLTSNVYEFVAGLYSGDTAFLRKLASTPTGQPGRTLLSAAVDLIRRVLGMDVTQGSILERAMGLSDELMSLGQGARRAGVEDFRTAAAAVDQATATLAQRSGDTLAWNLHKTMSKWSKSIADLFVDDPLSMAKQSVESQRQAIRRDLTQFQVRYEDLMSAALARRGFGVWQRITRGTQGGIQTQRAIERDLATELLARQEAQRTGIPRSAADVDPEITALADAWDNTMGRALREMQAAGVPGAEDLAFSPGYFSRSASPAGLQKIMQKLEETQGLTAVQSRAAVRDLVQRALASANPDWDEALSRDVAGAWVDRALRKGDMEDSPFTQRVSSLGVSQVRDLLAGQGLSPERVRRVMDVLEGVQDEAGRAPFLKSRLNMDMHTSADVGGVQFSMIDLLNTDLTRSLDQYLDRVSGLSALSRKGINGFTDIATLRRDFVRSAPTADRQEAARLFDNMIAYTVGMPTGEDMPKAMRKMGAVTQMVSLRASGLWQLTELAVMMQRYGMVRAFRYFGTSMPGFGKVARELADPANASDLRNLLAQGSYNDIRLRPFIQRLEDNFQIDEHDIWLSRLNHAKQLTPYVNGMKYIHKHQSIMAANMVVDTFVKAARSVAAGAPDERALTMLSRYGLERHMLGTTVATDLAQHGMDVARWSDGTWDAVRPALSKMMDEAVLKNRLGEIPAFAQFSSLGKFMFTFRSFILGAHNKILAGTLHRQGFAGLTALALYQWPMAMLAVMADNTLAGKEPITPDEAALRALSQMGSMGGLSELWGVVSGEKRQFGSPGMIGFDRMYNVAAQAVQGDAGGTVDAVLQTIPLVSILPSVRAIGENLK